MKKAFDQTVRDLKREVNKKVLKVPSVEQKILDATSNEPWGPHGSLLADIAHASKNSYEYQMIMTVIWKRINDTGKNWRHVYKGLTVLDYLVAHGSERVIDDIKEHAYQVSSLSEFQYIDSKGRDQGNNVRRKSQSLVALVNDKERIAEVREKALANRDKYRSTFATDGNYRSGGRYDDDRYDSRYGSRDDERYGIERDGGYRDDDRYGRYGDRNGRDSEDRYTYRDDDYRGRNRNDDYKFGSRSRSAERDRDRPYDDEDRSGGGGRSDGLSHEPRPLERKLSEPNISAPPSYGEATKDTPSNIPDTKRDERTSDIPAPKAPLPPQPKVSISETASTAPTVVAPAEVTPAAPAVGPSTSTFNEGDAFDEFDPRSFVPGSGNSVDMDLFGSLSIEDSINSLALVPVSASTTTLEPDLPVNSGFNSNFVASSAGQPSSNPFGDTPFMAGQDNFAAQPQNNPSASFHAGYTSVSIAASQAPVAPSVESSSGFDFGESFQAVSYPTNAPGFPPAAPAAQPSNDVLEGLFLPSGSTASFPPQGSLPRTQTAPAEFTTQTATPEFLTQSGFSAPPPFQGAPPAYNAQPAMPSRSGLMPKAASTNQLASQGAPLSLLSTPLAPQGATTTYSGAAAKAPQPKDKFETKSTVWADTISRGLVDLNISGPKTNPNASLGIDFDSLNRKEKREKEKSSTVPPVSTVSMGKAMGSGSGIGRVGATGLAPPPNPMMGSAMGMGGMGMGMGMAAYGGGMNQPMGMGMGMGMNMGMGMGMRPNPGMPPAPGMPGYNPMTGTGGYGSQPYGGYR